MNDEFQIVYSPYEYVKKMQAMSQTEDAFQWGHPPTYDNGEELVENDYTVGHAELLTEFDKEVNREIIAGWDRTLQVGGSHYAKRAVQPLEYILANKLDFSEGNIVKYITRWKDKGQPLDDLDKVIDYAQKLKADYIANPERYTND